MLKDLHLANEQWVDGNLANAVEIANAPCRLIVLVDLVYNDEVGIGQGLSQLFQAFGWVFANDLVN